MRKVYIEWYDAYERYGWLSEKDALKDLDKRMVCKSTGWLISINKKRVIISTSFNETSIMGGLHIPVACIKKFKYIK